MDNNPDIRVGDAERHLALEKLGEHFADGYLTMTEFNERTEAAIVATTQSELQQLFKDLPTDSKQILRKEDDADRELQALLDKGERLKVFDGIAFAISLATVGLLIFADFDYTWAGFIIAMAVALGGRAILDIDDDSEKIIEEFSESDSKRRAERLRLAAEKRRQLEQRHQNPD